VGPVLWQKEMENIKQPLSGLEKIFFSVSAN
jgi:hypothetical protein